MISKTLTTVIIICANDACGQDFRAMSFVGSVVLSYVSSVKSVISVHMFVIVGIDDRRQVTVVESSNVLLVR